MDFLEKIKKLSERAEKIKDSLETEEATKMSLIMPFFQMLGYDFSDPEEVVPEYTADFGVKKGARIDYAVLREGLPILFIEAKPCGEKLEKHGSQLFAYYNTTASAKFGILTNGIVYRFYTDLEKSGLMDDAPFLEFDILNMKDEIIGEIKKFSKDDFDIDKICSTASKLKYVNQFKQYFADMLVAPSDEFVKFFMGASEVYTGVKNQNAIEKYRPWLSQALNDYISEVMKEKINKAINAPAPTSSEPATLSKIITTEEELQGFAIIQNILKDTVSVSDVAYKDCQTYFAVLYKGITTKWICRLKLNDGKQFIVFPDDEMQNGRHVEIGSIFDISNYKSDLIYSVSRYL
ncbi:MAG: hypothetical protein BWY46_01391 [Firmicutes bacterium ADurb.Bin300]|nr:MAG: hypothetical protein BWY46_01391 [Firmicutes bacterium ADurb.Bin300]